MMNLKWKTMQISIMGVVITVESMDSALTVHHLLQYFTFSYFADIIFINLFEIAYNRLLNNIRRRNCS